VAVVVVVVILKFLYANVYYCMFLFASLQAFCGTAYRNQSGSRCYATVLTLFLKLLALRVFLIELSAISCGVFGLCFYSAFIILLFYYSINLIY